MTVTLSSAVALSALVLSVVVNVALIAYTWGSLRQIVANLKVVVDSLSSTVSKLDSRTDRHESRIVRLETACEKNHGTKPPFIAPERG